MSDTTLATTNETSAPSQDFPTMEFPRPRPVLIGVLARAEAAEQAALARVSELEALLNEARTSQITDGGDPRLVNFWEKAGRIADHADFCDEYDRLADAMNGTQRTRDWDVELEMSFTIRLRGNVNATNEDDAINNFRDDLSTETVIEALRSDGWDDYDLIESSASRG